MTTHPSLPILPTTESLLPEWETLFAALGRRLAKDDTKDGRAYRVLKVVKGRHVETTVRVGLMNRMLAEVKDGLSDGDEVAVESKGEQDDKTNAIPRRMRNMGGRL